MGEHILVVDDDADDLTSMKELLEKEGYQVSIATNGAEALDLVVGDDFKLILLDIQMPALSGYEILRLLREKINHHAKLIYVSIVPSKEVDMTDSDGFIQKPFTPEDFVATVKKSLEP